MAAQRWSYPGMPDMNPDDQAAAPTQRGYPLAEYAVCDPAQQTTTVLAKGVRTLVPLPSSDPTVSTPTSGRAFSEFATRRVDPAGSRLRLGTVNDLEVVRFTVSVIRDQSALATLLATLMTTLSNAGPFQYVLNSLQGITLELDVGSAYGPVFGDTSTVGVLPATIGLTVPLYGGGPGLANGVKLYATASTSGLALTDSRVLVMQGR